MHKIRSTFAYIGLSLLAIAGISACSEKPAKPAQAKVSTPAPQVEATTCRCGKPQCSDPNAWKWYVPGEQRKTGVFWYERDNGAWDWRFYPNQKQGTAPVQQQSSMQYGGGRMFRGRGGAACSGPGCGR